MYLKFLLLHTARCMAGQNRVQELVKEGYTHRPPQCALWSMLEKISVSNLCVSTLQTHTKAQKHQSAMKTRGAHTSKYSNFSDTWSLNLVLNICDFLNMVMQGLNLAFVDQCKTLHNTRSWMQNYPTNVQLWKL